MLRYSLTRILWLIPVIICVAFLIFALMDMAPGTVVDSMKTAEMTQEDIDTLMREYDLDKPMIYRYGKYMWGLVRGDLGKSLITGIPVWQSYISRFPKTLQLALAALAIGIALSIPLGIFAAKHAGTIGDNLTTVFSLLGMSMPGFWLGLLLIIWFAYKIRIFPSGYNGTLLSYVLPAISSGLAMAAITTRQVRSAVLENTRADYLRTARAKGVSERAVINKHALGNAWIPILTAIGANLSRSVAGSAVIEAVYSWPGVGRLTVEAVSQRDVPLVCGCVILTSILYVVMLLLVDITYALVDPRIKSQFASVKKRRKFTRRGWS